MAVDQPNPLRPTFILSSRGRRHGNSGGNIPIKKSTINRIGTYLCSDLLQGEYSLGEERHPILQTIPADEATEALSQQIAAYARGDYPFNSSPTTDEATLQWWTKHMHHSGSSLLAVCSYYLYRIAP